DPVDGACRWQPAFRLENTLDKGDATPLCTQSAMTATGKQASTRLQPKPFTPQEKNQHKPKGRQAEKTIDRLRKGAWQPNIETAQDDKCASGDGEHESTFDGDTLPYAAIWINIFFFRRGN